MHSLCVQAFRMVEKFNLIEIGQNWTGKVGGLLKLGGQLGQSLDNPETVGEGCNEDSLHSLPLFLFRLCKFFVCSIATHKSRDSQSLTQDGPGVESW